MDFKILELIAGMYAETGANLSATTGLLTDIAGVGFMLSSVFVLSHRCTPRWLIHSSKGKFDNKGACEIR